MTLDYNKLVVKRYLYLVACVLLALGLLLGYYIGYNLGIKRAVVGGDQPSKGIACTMDAKICPDGSAVGRVPPSCEFTPCPGE